MGRDTSQVSPMFKFIKGNIVTKLILEDNTVTEIQVSSVHMFKFIKGNIVTKLILEGNTVTGIQVRSVMSSSSSREILSPNSSSRTALSQGYKSGQSYVQVHQGKYCH